MKGYRPTLAGVAVTPITGALVPTSIIVGRLMTRFGCYRWAFWLGWAVTIAGTGLLILLDTDTQTHAWILIFVIAGIGHGFVLMSYNVCVQAMADTRNVAYAAGMYTFIRTLGMCIGVAVGGTVFQNQLKQHFRESQLPTAVANNATQFIAELRDPSKTNPTQELAYIHAYAKSFKVVFGVLTAIAGLAAFLSLFIKEYTMDKVLDSEHVLHQEKELDTLEDNLNTD